MRSHIRQLVVILLIGFFHRFANAQTILDSKQQVNQSPINQPQLIRIWEIRADLNDPPKSLRDTYKAWLGAKLSRMIAHDAMSQPKLYLKVMEVNDHSPASQAGIQQGDLLKNVDQKSAYKQYFKFNFTSSHIEKEIEIELVRVQIQPTTTEIVIDTEKLKKVKLKLGKWSKVADLLLTALIPFEMYQVEYHQLTLERSKPLLPFLIVEDGETLDCDQAGQRLAQFKGEPQFNMIDIVLLHHLQGVLIARVGGHAWCESLSDVKKMNVNHASGYLKQLIFTSIPSSSL